MGVLQDGAAAIHVAVRDNNMECLGALLSCGAAVDVDLPDSVCLRLLPLNPTLPCTTPMQQGRTALYIAAESGFPHVLKLLIRHGANKDHVGPVCDMVLESAFRA